MGGEGGGEAGQERGGLRELEKREGSLRQVADSDRGFRLEEEARSFDGRQARSGGPVEREDLHGAGAVGLLGVAVSQFHGVEADVDLEVSFEAIESEVLCKGDGPEVGLFGGGGADLGSAVQDADEPFAVFVG